MNETTNPAGGISGLGGATYAYDALSRLTSETRTINDAATGFNQSFTFNYEYDLAGQLTDFSDPNDLPRSISYTRDKIGRVTAVKNNQPTRFANVENYATNIQYRAFGAVKSLTYGTVGTGKNLMQTFNNRLQLEQFNVSGGTSTQDNLGSQNKYYADGQIKSAADLYDNRFDRLYKYDHLGRIKEAKSGIEARDPAATSSDRPYRQTYDYNAFGNLTNRTGEVWNTTAEPLTAAYTNNRRQNWAYDADGRNAYNENVFSLFDAAGRRYSSEGDSSIVQTFDGNGQRIKQTEQPPSGALKRRYYINSSVLGTIYEFEQVATSWRKRTGVVYLNGQQIAIQNTANNNTQAVWWFYENSATGATRGTTTAMGSEPDPLGVNNGTAPPPPEPPEYPDYVPDFILPSRIVDPSDMTNGCQWGGLPISCGSLEELTNEERRISSGRVRYVPSAITSGNSWLPDLTRQGGNGFFYSTWGKTDVWSEDGKTLEEEGEWEKTGTYWQDVPEGLSVSNMQQWKGWLRKQRQFNINPCAGATLNYNAGGNTGWNHIVDRHIDQTPYWKSQNKSEYGWGYLSTPNLDARKSRTTAINNLTFNYGGVTVQTDSRGRNTYVYVLGIADINIGNVIQAFVVGTDNQTLGHQGQFTNLNTLIVGNDCEVVITSHPGLPGPSTPYPNVNGPQKWWTPTWVLPF